ncbi:g2433 [Coccomyxa viridis]|uniref:G2433 protein n=1 Tax=Coccomyxa viridis TaxID=1274662 RepID=A0ABP1FM17_9CHLO
MSGLTLGLMSMDVLDMEVLRKSGSAKEKEWAKRIEPVLRHPHFLLVTLVLCNAAATEALPIFLDRLADPITAVLLSITVVLIFGEIIPQAVCSRYGLQVGAYSAWFVRALMWLCFIIAWPISKILDSLLGHEQAALFRRSQLKAMLDIHGIDYGLGGDLSEDEITVIRGALDLSHKTATSCMTPLDKVFMLSADAVVDEAVLLAILESGHSRVPVHKPGSREDVIGIIIVKELILVEKEAGVRVGDLKLRSAPQMKSDTRLYDMLRLFETGRCHLAVLVQAPGKPVVTGPKTPRNKAVDVSIGAASQTNGSPEERIKLLVAPSEGEAAASAAPAKTNFPEVPEGRPLGIITIEDVIEELLQQEIVDETDRYVDNLRLQRVNAALLTSRLPKHLRKIARQQITRIGHLAQLRGGNITHRLPPHGAVAAEGSAHPSDDMESDIHAPLLSDPAPRQNTAL